MVQGCPMKNFSCENSTFFDDFLGCGWLKTECKNFLLLINIKIFCMWWYFDFSLFPVAMAFNCYHTVFLYYKTPLYALYTLWCPKTFAYSVNSYCKVIKYTLQVLSITQHYLCLVPHWHESSHLLPRICVIPINMVRGTTEQWHNYQHPVGERLG